MGVRLDVGELSIVPDRPDKARRMTHDILNLSAFDSDDSVAIGAIRQRFLDVDATNGPDGRFRPKDVETREVRLPCGLQVAVALRQSKRDDGRSERSIVEALRVGSRAFNLGVRVQRPYTARHLIVGTREREQDDFGNDEIELLLRMALILNGEFEVFYNGIAPTVPSFHLQIVERRTTAWGAGDRWPARLEELSGHFDDLLDQLRERVSKVREITIGGNTGVVWCDLIAHFDDAVGRVLVIPRRIGEVRPLAWEAEPDDSAPYEKKAYGTWGALEMAGFFLAAKSEAAWSMLTKQPALYERGLRSLSL